MIKLDFEVNDEQAKKVMDAVRKKLLDLSPEMADIRQYAASTIQQHFNQAQGSKGAWQPRKDKKGTWPILQKSKALRRSFVEGAAIKGDKLSIQIYSTKPYDKVHQYGYPKKNIPMRDFVWFSKKDTEAMAQLIANGF